MTTSAAEPNAARSGVPHVLPQLRALARSGIEELAQPDGNDAEADQADPPEGQTRTGNTTRPASNLHESDG